MDINYKIEILKQNEDQRKVWGIFSLSTINGKFLQDSQGHVIRPETMQKMAHDFVLNARIAGREHDEMGVGQLIESFVFTKETNEALEAILKSIGVEDPVIQPNSDFWVGAFYISDDETWELIKSGEYEAFSIGGMGMVSEIDVNTFADI